jgi:dihydropteroate synthase
MGVLNVTPDSFSDGGLYLNPELAIERGFQMVREGAHIVDVGGESTRPGAEPVAPADEMERVEVVIRGLVERGLDARISIDTSKASVAAAALQAGASFVNDVTALRGDGEMAAVIASAGADCCLMHMLGEPRTMQLEPRYEDVVDDVRAFLEERMTYAVGQGISEERIVLDPGIGFGKTLAHNLELLARLAELAELGRPLLVGTSRKSFLARLSKGDPGELERLPGTIATNVMAYERGASIFRVHDVAPLADALAVTAATLAARWTRSPARSQTS